MKIVCFYRGIVYSLEKDKYYTYEYNNIRYELFNKRSGVPEVNFME